MMSPWRALWLTMRPKTLTAAVVPVFVGTALAAGDGFQPTHWIWVCALLSALFIQIGTNIINDVLDFEKGADSETRLGEPRAAQQGWFSVRALRWLGWSCFGIALLLGLPLVWQGGWPIFWIGLFSILMGYLYTGGPFPLAYVGLGDLFVILFFGVIAVGGMYFLHAQTLSASAIVAGLQVGLLATLLLAINNLRDMHQDKLVNKKTLAVRLGPKLARWEVLVLVVVTFALNFYWWHRGVTWAALLTLLTLPLALHLTVALLRTEPSREYNRFLARAGLLHMLFGLLLGIGLLNS